MLESAKRHAQTALDSVNRNAKAAINFLDKVFGAIVGVTLFSLTSLVLNLLMALALIAFTLSVRVVLPIAAAYWAFKVTHSLSLTLFSTLMVLGLNRLILPPVLLLSSVKLVLKAGEDLAYAVPYGLTNGYNKGLAHVVSQWWKIPFSFLSYLRAEDENIQAISQDFFDLPSVSFRLPSSGARIRSLLRIGDNEFPGLDEALQRSFNHSQTVVKPKLTPTEFAQFELKLSSSQRTAFVPLSEQELLDAASIKELAPVLEKYKEVSSTLSNYDAVLAVGGEFDDQIIPMMAVSEPIILVKQVRIKESPETWTTLPAYIWLTDKGSLERCMGNNTELPNNRDRLNGTDSIDGKPTRYRYYAYEKGSKYAPGLDDMAATIRSRLQPQSSISVSQEKEKPVQAEARGFLAGFSRLFGRSTPLKPNVSDVPSLTL